MCKTHADFEVRPIKSCVVMDSYSLLLATCIPRTNLLHFVTARTVHDHDEPWGD